MPARDRRLGRRSSRTRTTVSEKLSPGRFAALRRSYAERSSETVRLDMTLHINLYIYVDSRHPERRMYRRWDNAGETLQARRQADVQLGLRLAFIRGPGACPATFVS